ncbi:peroxiredoxin [Roseobacter weihaiensis]|uniref:peroxiredoxin n=1 Tax=Roseobacter weihaiensis TaxID=2763262 RepID=UPI001D0B34B8|nr:peroxiredoxin [Roseobacter sp. H9]
MTLLLGDTVPDFSADTTLGPITFHDWIGEKWAFFFSHPVDFTPVCTTEMGRTAQLAEEFAERCVKPIGLSTDDVGEHLKWGEDVNDTRSTTLRFPIVADPDCRIAKLYEMIHPGESVTAAVRAVFIIDSDKKLRLSMTYPMTVGRNFDEILRVIDALQISARKRVALPADWRPGDRAIIPPSVSDADAAAQFPKGFETTRPYLRTVDIDAA